MYRIIDVGGQRSERKKWMHHFEDVDMVLFLVALSEYDQALYEDGSVNRLQEALDLFNGICQSQWFTQTAVQLVFNKTDLFREKLKTSPLECYFPDFQGKDGNAKSRSRASIPILSRLMLTDMQAAQTTRLPARTLPISSFPWPRRDTRITTSVPRRLRRSR